jgi:hypothetical protein
MIKSNEGLHAAAFACGAGIAIASFLRRIVAV